MNPGCSGYDNCFLTLALKEPVTVISEVGQQVGKMEGNAPPTEAEPLYHSQLKLTPHSALYSLPWALPLALSQLPQEAERVGISSSHPRDREVNCLQSPQS